MSRMAHSLAARAGTATKGDETRRTHFALHFFCLGTTLCIALVSLAPFLAHDNIVLLELLDRFEARSALVLDSLPSTFDSLIRVLESELHILKTTKKKKYKIFGEDLVRSSVPADLGFNFV